MTRILFVEPETSTTLRSDLSQDVLDVNILRIDTAAGDQLSHPFTTEEDSIARSCRSDSRVDLFPHVIASKPVGIYRIYGCRSTKHGTTSPLKNLM